MIELVAAPHDFPLNVFSLECVEKGLNLPPSPYRLRAYELESMASSSSSHQQSQEFNAFSGIEPAGKRRKVSESSRLFDVFINHRGPDVKQTLATQLYYSLQQLQILAFLDSEEKELGDYFPSTIETAIRSAKVHIAIFSKRYAESPWCLAELVLMLESKAKIIPVFYEVEPWELRHIEKGQYADAFINYEKKGRYLEKLNEWKEALQILSFVTGEEFHSDCKNIVAAVQKEIQSKQSLFVAKYPVGLHNLVEDFQRRCLNELVQDFENQCGLEERKQSPNAIAIFGMGGSGKTTLAKELFNRKRSNYSGASFLSDVREASVRSELPSLQAQLLKDLFHEDKLTFPSIVHGSSYLKDRLQRSLFLNFLIVVDDIDHMEQLDALCVMDIFDKSGNSLVIVTTRDVGVVINAGITVSFHLKGMDRNHARQLFCWHAFDRPLPCTGYEVLVDQFVDVCGGLPLSLQVLGRLVHGRSHSYWNLKLTKTGKTLPLDVKHRLRISFDALDDEEKQVFMDIACFFVGKPKFMAERICEGSGWDAQSALSTLKDKCLVEEEEYFSILNNQVEIVLRMHDHLRDLGREMALQLSPPWRLWHPRDLKSLELTGLETILAKTNARCFHSIFNVYRNSQVTFFLGQSDSCVETSTLLWLELEGDFTEQPSIPSWIPLHNLQCLKIVGGQLKTLRENHIQISPYWHQLSTSCRDLQRVSGSGDLTKLRELIICDCPKLEELPSLGGLNCMENIEISYCEKLQNIMLPPTLISVSVRSCRALQRLVGYSDLIKLTELIISECPELEELPSLSRLRCMKNIQIYSCEKLQNITLPPSLISLSIQSCRNLQRVVGYGDLIILTELNISECPELEELGSTDLIKETKLIINEFPELEDFPSLARVSCMDKIKIHSCEKLQNISLPTPLISLSVHSCRDLQRVIGSGDLIKLTELIICECPELKGLPSLSRLSCMEKIKIHSCEKLQNITLPPALISLSVHSCRDLQSVVGCNDLIKLTELFISECPKLKGWLPSLSRVSCMEKIKIHSCEKLQNISLPTTLIILSVHNCRDLQTVVGSGDLIKLTELFISDCPELEELPSLSRLSCMQKIEIDSCEKLDKISGIEELHALQWLRLGHCNNAVIRNCIHKLKSVPRKMDLIGRAVDGAESFLNEGLFSHAHVGADAVTEIVTQNSDDVDINEWCKSWEVMRAAVIGCYVVVVDSSTSAEDINKSLQLYDNMYKSLYEDDYTETWPKVREGEWIIIMVACDDWSYDYNYKNAEDVLRRKGIIKKGFRVEVNKGEEWKSVTLLGTIVDKLYHL